MKNKFFKAFSLVALVLFFTGCAKTLDRKPPYDVTSATVYENFSNYKSILAKLYAGLAVSGQQGPSWSSLTFLGWMKVSPAICANTGNCRSWLRMKQ
jgi:hypothetical protein